MKLYIFFSCCLSPFSLSLSPNCLICFFMHSFLSGLLLSTLDCIFVGSTEHLCSNNAITLLFLWTDPMLSILAQDQLYFFSSSFYLFIYLCLYFSLFLLEEKMFVTAVVIGCMCAWLLHCWYCSGNIYFSEWKTIFYGRIYDRLRIRTKWVDCLMESEIHKNEPNSFGEKKWNENCARWTKPKMFGHSSAAQTFVHPFLFHSGFHISKLRHNKIYIRQKLRHIHTPIIMRRERTTLCSFLHSSGEKALALIETLIAKRKRYVQKYEQIHILLNWSIWNFKERKKPNKWF